MTCSVAIVGAGPTAIYTLNALLALRPGSFEPQDAALLRAAFLHPVIG